MNQTKNRIIKLKELQSARGAGVRQLVRVLTPTVYIEEELQHSILLRAVDGLLQQIELRDNLMEQYLHRDGIQMPEERNVTFDYGETQQHTYTAILGTDDRCTVCRKPKRLHHIGETSYGS